MYDSGLTDEVIAVEFLARGSGVFTADALAKWMRQRGIGHRSAVAVAGEVNRLQAESARHLPTPEQAAWQRSIREGTTADDAVAMQWGDELAQAGQVANMSVAEFGEHRSEFGLSKSTFDHLSGR